MFLDTENHMATVPRIKKITTISWHMNAIIIETKCIDHKTLCTDSNRVSLIKLIAQFIQNRQACTMLASCWVNISTNVETMNVVFIT